MVRGGQQPASRGLLPSRPLRTPGFISNRPFCEGIKLEERISQIAKQPGQTRDEVKDEFLRKCSDKRHLAERAAIGGQRRPCMLVMSNWSAHALVAECSRFGAALSFFDVVMLIEFDEVYCIYPQ